MGLGAGVVGTEGEGGLSTIWGLLSTWGMVVRGSMSEGEFQLF